MKIPAHRFASLDYYERMQIYGMWNRAIQDRAKAQRLRKCGWMIEASHNARMAIKGIQNVKFWATKAQMDSKS